HPPACGLRPPARGERIHTRGLEPDDAVAGGARAVEPDGWRRLAELGDLRLSFPDADAAGVKLDEVTRREHEDGTPPPQIGRVPRLYHGIHGRPAEHGSEPR